ncbi:hypothetical protein AWB81_06864 [Caballeronia arationis]|jgi:hypothetical protein|uniref:Uncharacterized protein n=1 Tax=Caballeronia arationis TaxID=1777142 RepID=A0A7Z7N0L5_9BURK|nr:hypothetical protein AWB81_06864 [Caballeronia arationis]SOE54622.1 hypothetical protein SAMN05446927_0866 [Caballeronia arationis]
MRQRGSSIRRAWVRASSKCLAGADHSRTLAVASAAHARAGREILGRITALGSERFRAGIVRETLALCHCSPARRPIPSAASTSRAQLGLCLRHKYLVPSTAQLPRHFYYVPSSAGHLRSFVCFKRSQNNCNKVKNTSRTKTEQLLLPAVCMASLPRTEVPQSTYWQPQNLRENNNASYEQCHVQGTFA